MTSGVNLFCHLLFWRIRTTQFKTTHYANKSWYIIDIRVL